MFSNRRKYNLSHALGKILIVGMALFAKKPSYLYLDCMNFISEVFVMGKYIFKTKARCTRYLIWNIDLLSANNNCLF